MEGGSTRIEGNKKSNAAQITWYLNREEEEEDDRYAARHGAVMKGKER
jgi:hypothetical protein